VLDNFQEPPPILQGKRLAVHFDGERIHIGKRPLQGGGNAPRRSASPRAVRAISLPWSDPSQRSRIGAPEAMKRLTGPSCDSRMASSACYMPSQIQILMHLFDRNRKSVAALEDLRSQQILKLPIRKERPDKR